MTTPRNWSYYTAAAVGRTVDFPPDLLYRWRTRTQTVCGVTWRGPGFVCTRSPGHTRRHAAATVRRQIIAVWGDNAP